MFTHKYKASIEGSKLFMREYDVLGDMNLFKFQTFLVNDLEFSCIFVAEARQWIRRDS